MNQLAPYRPQQLQQQQVIEATVTHEIRVVHEYGDAPETRHMIAAVWIVCGVACLVIVGVFVAYYMSGGG